MKLLKLVLLLVSLNSLLLGCASVPPPVVVLCPKLPSPPASLLVTPKTGFLTSAVTDEMNWQERLNSSLTK